MYQFRNQIVCSWPSHRERNRIGQDGIGYVRLRHRIGSDKMLGQLRIRKKVQTGKKRQGEDSKAFCNVATTVCKLNTLNKWYS